MGPRIGFLTGNFKIRLSGHATFIKFADLLEERLFRIYHYQLTYSWLNAERLGDVQRP